MMRAVAGREASGLTRGEHHDPFVGTVLDHRFRIDGLLASGGFGAIYRATDLHSDAEVALKVLHPKFTRDRSGVARFRREGKMLASLRDPHTITAYELGEAPDGTLYIVMELLHGESLYARFRAGGPLPWRRVVHIARGVCSSLAEAHALGIVHRDLKPANIHLETRGDDPDFVKVLDFGIAKIVQSKGHERTELTQIGTMVGTIVYMSPEQMIGSEVAAGSDIYTLGVLMYEMIAGRTPFADAQTATAVLTAVLTQTPDPLSKYAPVPPALEQIVARCLERELPNRFADVNELADALARVAAVGLPRSNPAVPSSGLERPMLSTAATRIGVRLTESSRPVLDVRGPRYRPIDAQGTPPPILTPPHGAAHLAQGSGPVAPAAVPSPAPVAYAPTIAVTYAAASAAPPAAAPPAPAYSAAAYPTAPAPYPSAAPVAYRAAPVAYPAAPVAYPAAPVAYPAAPVAYPAAPVAYPAAPVAYSAARGVYAPTIRVAYPPAPPIVNPVGSPYAIDAAHPQPRTDDPGSQPVINLAAWQGQQQLGQPGIAPGVRTSPHGVRRYDMSAAATRDTMVRRIVISVALVACGLLAFLVASHL